MIEKKTPLISEIFLEIFCTTLLFNNICDTGAHASVKVNKSAKVYMYMDKYAHTHIPTPAYVSIFIFLLMFFRPFQLY